MFEEWKEKFDEYSVHYCAELPEEEALSEITFSEKLQKRIERLLHHQKRFYYSLINSTAKRVAGILIACLLIMAATTVSVKGIREKFTQFAVETFEKFSKVTFIEESQGSGKVNICVPNYPQYIPEGFEKVYEFEDSTGADRIYEKGEYSIVIEQHSINQSFSTSINTEGVEYRKIFINEDCEAMLVEKLDMRIITFRNKNQAYVIMIDDIFPESELIKIAESINFEK